MVGGLGRDRIHELFLDLVAPQIGDGDRPRDRTSVARRVVRHHVSGADQPRRLHGNQLGIARTQPDPVQHPARRVHSTSLPIALTPAPVIALPPRRPCTTRYGRPEAASACLDSAAPTNPTGMPITAAGRGPPAVTCAAVISSRRNSAVGALPIATTAPSSRSPHRSTAAADRVVPSRAASPATAGSRRVQMISLP